MDGPADNNETDPKPDQHEARIALQEVNETERAVRAPDTPWWWFALNAVLFAGLTLTQLRDDHATTFAAVGVLILVVNLFAARAAGVEGTSSRNRGFVASMLLSFVVLFGSLPLHDATGEPLVVYISAGVVAVLLMVGGWFYRRNPS